MKIEEVLRDFDSAFLKMVSYHNRSRYRICHSIDLIPYTSLVGIVTEELFHLSTTNTLYHGTFTIEPQCFQLNHGEGKFVTLSAMSLIVLISDSQ